MGQKEVPVLGAGDALMGVAPQNTITFRDYDVPETSRANQLSVFGTSGNVKPNMSAITTAPQNPLPAPNEVNSALNQQVLVGGGQTQTPKFFEPGGFGYENLGPRLGANIGQFAGEQLYGTGFTADGDPTGFPVDRPTLAGDLLTLPGTALNVASIVTDPLVTATEGTISGVKNLKDYVTGDTGVQAQQEKAAESLANQGITSESVSQDLAQSVPQEDQSLINSVQVDTGTDVASIPQGETGSPQANFSERMASGKPLTQEEITAANAFAKSMGTTFNPETGYSRDAFLGSQATAPRSDTFPNDAGVQRTRDELMRRFGAPTISQIQEQDAIRTSGNVAIPAPAAVNNFAPQTPSVRATPAPFPNTEGREIRDALFRGNPQQGAVPAFSTESGTRPNVDPGFIQQPSLRDPDAGFIRPAPNLSDFERESLARESRLDARPDFNEAISDRDRRAARGEGLSQADARDLAQGMDPNASEGQRMRALEIQSRLGLGQFKPEKELSDLEKREIESRIRGRDADIAALERKGGFEPRVIDVGGERAMELSPGYFQRIAKDTPKKTGLQTTIENLQSDLDSGRLTQEQYDIAVSNAKNLYIGLKQPKQNETDVSNRISELQNQAMGVTSAEGTDASDVKSYATEAEAKASGVKGEVLIGGRRAVIE